MADLASTASKEASRVPLLDAVRGVAICAVIATHSLTATVAAAGRDGIPTPVFKLFDYGQFGVQLFFVLSGWLMFSLYTGYASFSQRVYWSRRIARIWPLWAIFVVASFIWYSVPESGLPTWLAMLMCLLFLGWWSAALVAVPLGGLTIQQEMGHYLLFSLFRRRGAAFFAGTVIVGFITAQIAYRVVPMGGAAAAVAEAWLRLALFNSWPFFLLGGLGLVVYRRWRIEGVTGVFDGRWRTPVLVGVALACFLLTTYSQETPAYFVLGYVLAGIGLAVVLNAIPGVSPAMRSIGRYSYFMYFFHFWVLRWLEQRYRDSSLPEVSTSIVWNVGVLVSMFLIALGLSWALGWVSWRLLEQRVLRLAHRYVR